MTQRWTRPKSVPFPSVWSRFSGLKEINGVIPKFWIQDITDDQIETVIRVVVEMYINEEPMCRHSNLASDKQSKEYFSNFWRKGLQDKLGLICYMENPDLNGAPIIAAINGTHCICKGVNPPTFGTGKKFLQVIKTAQYVSNMKDYYEELGVDHLLSAMGLYVRPEFRGQGLGLEMLKARKPLCRAVGIPGSITLFTATVSQRLATKVGFKDLSVISYADLEKLYPELQYPGVEEHTKALKYMYILYN